MSQKIIVPAGESPKRLENFLKKEFPIGYVRRVLRKNGVRVNGERSKPDTVVCPGDRLQFFIPFEKPAKPYPVSQPSRIRTVFEDENLLVLEKPAGIAVHEARGILKRHTVIGELETRYRTQGVVPRLVHRIDKDTSGLLLVAKNETTARRLEAAFAQGKIEKQYLCLVAGRLTQKKGTLDSPVPGRDGRPVPALTRFEVMKRFFDTTLLRVRIDTGRRHQIRLHFAKLGYPLVMDERHGDFNFNKNFRKKFGLKRQFLHAATLNMEHSGKKRSWSSPLPEDLQKALAALEPGGPERFT